MKKCILTGLSVFAMAFTVSAVDLVKNGEAVAEIVILENSAQGIKTAAEELQRRLKEMSGAKLEIVTKVSPDVKNQVYVGESEYTRKLGVKTDDIKFDGFKIIADKNYVVLAGKDIYHSAKSFTTFADLSRVALQAAWEKFCGHKWRGPLFYVNGDFSKECGFHMNDGTGTLYAVYEMLEQLGMRWYMPTEIGIVIPKLQNISVDAQNLKKEPEFPQRIFCNGGRAGLKDELLWYKSMKAGTSFVMPFYHAVGRLTYFGKEAPQEYFGVVGGKINYQAPKLTSEKLRSDFIEFLEFTNKAYPGIEYDCLGQPDGWSLMDTADAASGWDKAERGTYGRFSDYMWDFNMDIRKRIMQKQPDRKFTVFAYSGTTMPPSNVNKIPKNVTVGLLQHCTLWMLPPSNKDLELRDEWLKKMEDGKTQLLIRDHYLEQAPIRNTPPVPVIFTKFLKENLKGAYDNCAGYNVEVPWTPSVERTNNKSDLNLRRPGLSHLMIYLHNRLCWDRNLDMQSVLEEYYKLFFGPADAEMKEFHEFAESVWVRPEPREITVVGGFLKPADVDKYFDILKRAKAKAGDTVYGKRIDLIAAEMEPLKILFGNLKRSGPYFQGHTETEDPEINGDLNKPFWRTRADTFNPLRDMVTGKIPSHVSTSVSFRWLKDNSALVIGIECFEPKMDNLRASCKDRDSMAIFNDDNVEIWLETPQGIRPKIVVNPAGAVLDECLTSKVEDLPLFYTVNDVAVKKYPDRWTVELKIETKPISGERPTATFPWGVNICRKRLAGNTPESYMLSPSGTNFKDLKSMGNLFLK
jgi:hypothetical protein